MHTTEAMLDQLEALFAADAERTASGRIPIAAHMLQSAAAAAAAGAHDTLVAAALLHDIGHWLHDASAGPLDAGDDDNHGTTAAAFLGACFGPEVTRPVALHVAAKRYLCAREADYHARLSPGSVRSLEIQGGPMSEADARLFESSPGHEAALALRRWDEYGKIPALDVPDFVHYRPMLERLMGSHPGTA